MIEEEKVKHIAGLAHLTLKDEEMPKYQQQLTDILTEIDKIISLPLGEEEIMISPTTNRDCYKEDVIGTHLSQELAFKNAKHVKQDYIVVPKVVE